MIFIKYVIIYFFKRDIWNLLYIVFFFLDKIKLKIKVCLDDILKYFVDRIFLYIFLKFIDMFDDFNENLFLFLYLGGLFVKFNGVYFFGILNLYI